MASKLWEKNVQVDKGVEDYTVGRDREMDLYLAPYDILGSLAHITMLESIGLLEKSELEVLAKELKNIYAEAVAGRFVIEPGIEDVHSQVELMLTRKLGDMGKKIHSGRSRNDQVLVDLKLFMRSEIEMVCHAVEKLFSTLIAQSDRYHNCLIPGYTHLQVAMPSSIGLWLGAYAESLADDLTVLLAAYKVVNRNPLGSAAGYGSSFPLDRDMTTRLLGFDSMNYNVVYAQMGRGKTEKTVANALAGIAATVSRLAYDACLYNVFELTRAKCNRLQSLPGQITLILNNLPSGYFRDMQLIKEAFLPAFDELCSILNMVERMISQIIVVDGVANDERYKYMFSVEEVNRLTREGMPFRDAYKKVGLDIEAGRFEPVKEVHHTHAGSIGNLCNDRITDLFNATVDEFGFERYHSAIDNLLA